MLTKQQIKSLERGAGGCMVFGVAIAHILAHIAEQDKRIATLRAAASDMSDTVAMHSIRADGRYSRINTTELDRAIARLRAATHRAGSPD